MSLSGRLKGIRVLDLSMGWAGPLAGRHLADLGAEVIKVEDCSRFDWWRGWDVTPEVLRDNTLEKSAAFNTMNRNKLGITLDLSRDEGRELFERLVRVSHVVVENYSADVLKKLGLDYRVLSTWNAELVMISMPAFGTNGPWRGYRAYGSTIEQSSGLPHLNGHAHWPPTMQHVAYGDAIAGLNGAAALLTALMHRVRTGKGQHLDLSQAECIFPLAAHGILEQTVNGAPPPRRGSRRPDACPSGVFPCLGNDQWVAVQVTRDDEWRALCGVIGLDPDLTAEQRRACEDDIEAAIATWTSTRTSLDAMTDLQRVRVPAGIVRGSSELLEEPQLRARGFWQIRERAYVGLSPNPSAPYRSEAEPLEIDHPAPTLGQHNRDVLVGILGLSDAELTALEARGVIGSKPKSETAIPSG